MGIKQDVRKSWHDSIIELFELDLQPITGDSNDKYYFTGDIFPDGTKIRWQGEVYQPFPISITGFETTTKGTIPQPELTVANVLGTLAAVTNAFDDLVGARVIRRRTLGKYLDNGTNPDPSEEFPEDVYFIERKTSETSLSISWQLASKIDLEGLQIPRRIITQNYCVWKYRGGECGYSGPPVANDRDGPLVGDGSAASANYLSALNAFTDAKVAERNATYVRNLAQGQIASSCDTSTFPIAETYSELTGPDYSFAIVVDAQPLFGIVEGNVVDIASDSADYRATRSVRGSTKVGAVVVGDNSFGPLKQIDDWQEVAVEGGGTKLQVVASFYSETVPISFAFTEPSGTDEIGIVNGNIVPLVTSGAGYRVGSQRRSSLKGTFAIGLIDKDGALCESSAESLAAAEEALANAESELNSAEAALSAATAALPNTSALRLQDRCGKRLNSCRLRFGATNLPFGAFPGANTSR
jgi:lambda family phage minor tail protein L